MGGAKLGKSVKGKSKGKKGGKKKKDADDKLLSKAKQMEIGDYERALAQKNRAALREHLSKEWEMTKVNAKKVRNGWLKIMRLSKLDALRREVEVISQNHERDVDRRDALLQMLDRDVDEAEDQYQMALREHMLNVDNLILLQDTRLTTLEASFTRELESLEEEYSRERADMHARHAAERKELLDLIEAVNTQEAYLAAEIKQEFEQSREEVRNKNIEEINVLSATLDSHIEELERHFESAHMNYLQNTDKRTEEFKKLTREDMASSEDIERKIKQIERLQSSIAHWKVKIMQNSRDFNERNTALADEKSTMASHVHMLKTRMAGYRGAQGRRLRDLSMSVETCRADMEEKLEVASRLLKLAEVARKFETEREKVAPYYESDAAAGTVDKAKGLIPFLTQDPMAEDVKRGDATRVHGSTRVTAGAGAGMSESASLAEQERALVAAMTDEELAEYGLLKREGVLLRGNDMVKSGEVDALDLFYKKFNTVLLGKLAAENEKQRLADENRQLQSILKQFLEGISVTEGLMKAANPLLVVNGRANTMPPPVRRVAPPTVILEGNHLVETRRVGM